MKCAKNNFLNVLLTFFDFSRGTCKVCDTTIFCQMRNVASHKRAGCTISDEERLFWSGTYNTAPFERHRTKRQTGGLSAEEAKEYLDIYNALKVTDYMTDIDKTIR